jgi:pimeloyl-ACP methyl ester carboxylesterase
VSGLQFQVWWRRQAGVCREVAIAFRGTDRHDRGDWLSNFRWLHRLTPRFDQYDQVRTHIRRIVARIKANGCGGRDVLFVTVGHSLGGGLAQQAAYADGSIRYVYAFDSSPITGIFDVSALLRERNTQGLGVDRAYEAGEILVLPRILIENIVPPSPCNPRVRTVRFNLLMGSPIAQHSIAELTGKLSDSARTAGADPRRVDGARDARGCAAPPLMQLLAPPA